MPGLAETKVTSGQTRTWSQTDQSSSMRTPRPRRWIPIPVQEPSALIGVPETEFGFTANSEFIAINPAGVVRGDGQPRRLSTMTDRRGFSQATQTC